MTDNWSVFDAIEEVSATADATYFEPGRYLVKVGRVFRHKDRNEIPLVVAQTTVLAVTGTEIDLDGVTPLLPNQVGSTPSVVYKNGGNSKDSFLPNVKGMIAAMAGVPDTKITAKDVADVCNETPGATMEWPRGSGQQVELDVQPVQGFVMEVCARKKRKVRSEGVITRVIWVRQVPPEQVLAMVDETVLAQHFDVEALRAAATPQGQQPAAPDDVHVPF